MGIYDYEALRQQPPQPPARARSPYDQFRSGFGQLQESIGGGLNDWDKFSAGGIKSDLSPLHPAGEVPPTSGAPWTFPEEEIAPSQAFPAVAAPFGGSVGRQAAPALPQATGQESPAMPGVRSGAPFSDVPPEPPLRAADSYLRASLGGAPVRDWTPGSIKAPSKSNAETMGGLADRAFKPRPNAFSGMVGGIQTQGQLEQDAKAEGQFNDRWDSRMDQIDAEEESTADRYLRGAKNARELELLQESPYEAYARRADIDRQKSVGIATGTEEAKDAVRGRREQSIQADLNAINQEIATIDADLSQIDTDPRYLALPPERQAAAKAALSQKKAEQEAMRDARIQAAGIATGNAPGQMFKRGDDIPGGN